MTSRHGDIAIIGMACIYPKAPDLKTFWRNITDKVDAITDPPEGTGYHEVFDPENPATDRIYTMKGGWLGDLAKFDPMRFGILPKSTEGAEPDHFLALGTAWEALRDAGYSADEKPLDRKRVAVIIGKGTYITRGFGVVFQHGFVVDQTLAVLKQLHPEYTSHDLTRIKESLKENFPPFNADTIPAIVPNLLASRISNRLDFMGPSYVVDAACASSLIAVDHGVQDLLAKRCDMAVVGGVHTSTTPPILMGFCHINALSPTGQLRPFDKGANGTLLGEGVGILILKRREDAEKAGDRIYAVISGTGLASDGRALGLLAPRSEGAELALRRAYDDAGLDPRSVGLIEAHGTGTPAGDLSEIQALGRVFGPREEIPTIAVSAVKSMISHAIPAAGSAGLIKTAMALHHKVLPPTLNCDEPDPALEIDRTALYINSETRPWIHGGREPRRAGVNAFGFGGINVHIVMEEYTGDNAHDS